MALLSLEINYIKIEQSILKYDSDVVYVLVLFSNMSSFQYHFKNIKNISKSYKEIYKLFKSHVTSLIL